MTLTQSVTAAMQQACGYTVPLAENNLIRAVISEKTKSRFFSKVEKTESCWIWKAGHDRKGYGKFSVGKSRNANGTRRNSMVSAHRFSYEMANGKIQECKSFHGICVLPRRDNPACVRPDHLFIGTNSDNVHDMDKKGRRVTVAKRGGDHSQATLTEENVREIFRRHFYDGVPRAKLSKEYGVCLSTISHIFNGRLWAHLGLASPRLLNK